ncbi:unnamed protein product [Brassica rapa subsp. trilocularis]
MIMLPGPLVYRVDEDIHNVTDSAIRDIMSFTCTIIISMNSVLPYNGGGLVRLKKTDVVPRLKASGVRVFVETFSNEFVTQPLDLFSDSTVEIDFLVQRAKIDGIITDFPATTARYKNNLQSYLIANPMLLSPAQAPYPLLIKSDVMESPLPEVRSKQPPPSYAASKAVAKALHGKCL